jgi:predicted NBD/HSP70 family sugar kinase
MIKPGKATHEQLKRHNRQLLLRSVYSGAANSRAALAATTGLAKPTVSDLIGELIVEGLLEEGGLGESTDSGGKRPLLLNFVPDARQVIGVSIDAHEAAGVLANLAGQVVAEHRAHLDGASGEAAITILKEVINGLAAQLDAPLLCLGIGVNGLVDNAAIVRYAPSLGWRSLNLAERMTDHYKVPAYIGNNTELAAMAQFKYGAAENARNLATLLINHNVEVGIALEGAVYHHGGDIGSLRLVNADEARLDSFLGWSYVEQRAHDLKREYPQSHLPDDNLTYLHIHYGAAEQDPAALQLYDELAAHLAQVFAWMIGLLRPDHISLAGPIVDLGQSLLEQAAAKTQQMIQPDLVQAVTFSLADSANLNAAGAVAQALQNELGILG